jgi:hypothetical protein
MRTYPRHSRWHPDNRPPPYGQSFIRTTDDGTVHMSQRKNVGYGFTEGIIVGTLEGVSAMVDAIYRSYPSGAYGTIICWPPADDAPWAWRLAPYSGWSQWDVYAPYEQLGPDLWVLWYSHSESCE